MTLSEARLCPSYEKTRCQIYQHVCSVWEESSVERSRENLSPNPPENNRLNSGENISENSPSNIPDFQAAKDAQERNTRQRIYKKISQWVNPVFH